MRTVRLGILALLLSGCDESGPTAPTRSALVDVTWRLREFTRAGGIAGVVPGGDAFTLRFADDGRVSARVDCNSCSGSYQLSGPRLEIRQLACTRAFCGTDSLDTEFLRVFDGETTVALDADRLFISRAGARLVFSR